jgi:hypothetical protein
VFYSKQEALKALPTIKIDEKYTYQLNKYLMIGKNQSF